MVIINSVLNSLPLYFFSFYRAQRKVIQSLVTIQRKFLWQGWSENQKINWVSWEKICLLKQDGGLGNKNLEKFNICLLDKWWWQFLTDRSMIWYKLLSYRYGNLQQPHQMKITNT